MKKSKINLYLLLFLVVGNPFEVTTQSISNSSWNTGEPYHALKKGTKIQYTVYNGKGKVQGYHNQEVLEISRKGKNVNAVVASTQTDRKGKVQTGATVSLQYKNGNFYVDLLSILLPQGMPNMEIETAITGNDMIIPEKISPGQKLPDAQATFNMKMKGGGESIKMPPVVYRVFNREAVGEESVETPMGKYVCFKITQSVEVELPLIGKQVSSGIVWVGKGIGTVKTEGYDKKGKLQNRMLLTELK